MSKSLAASQHLMKTYLSELLTEEQIVEKSLSPSKTRSTSKTIEKEKLDRLLAQANVLKDAPKDAVITSTKSENKSLEQPIEDIEISTEKSSGTFKVKALSKYRDEAFQAMFFDVAGLTIAVPLIELGGIHNIDKTTSLMGKPDWFKGVMLHRDEKINVVDTAMWVMPEKCDESLKSSLNYQYIIVLNDSAWGLMAENLVDTVKLEPNDVKWLEQKSKRPWLAGLVKDRMCALLDVNALIQLLDEGANINKF